jgi:hypothetical protein
MPAAAAWYRAYGGATSGASQAIGNTRAGEIRAARQMRFSARIAAMDAEIASRERTAADVVSRLRGAQRALYGNVESYGALKVPGAAIVGAASFSAFAVLWRAMWDSLMEQVCARDVVWECGGPLGSPFVKSSGCGVITQSGKNAVPPFEFSKPLPPFTQGSWRRMTVPPPINAFWETMGQWHAPATTPARKFDPTDIGSRALQNPEPEDWRDNMPWLDPQTRAPLKNYPNFAPSWEIAPNRRPNPYRSPNEQSDFGPEPKPNPKPRPNPRPEPRPSDNPGDNPGIDPPGEVVPPVIVNPPLPPLMRPPGPNTKERKGAIARGYWALLTGYGVYTEARDLVNAIYGALPRSLRAKLRAAKGGNLDYVEKSWALYNFHGQINIVKAVENVVAENIGDYVSYRLHKPVNDLIRGLVPNFEKRMLARAVSRWAARELSGNF